MNYPQEIFHWIEDAEIPSTSNLFFEKFDPANGTVLAKVARGSSKEVGRATRAAADAYEGWTSTNIIARGDLLRSVVLLMQERKEELAEIVACESGKSRKDARGEVGAAIECGFFFAGEGRRYFGEVLQSSVPNREVKMVRTSIGVGALITPFNNPAAGVAWKLFTALLCGNTVVIKSHEDTPYVAVWYAKLFKDAGLPSGAVSVVQGLGTEVGAPLIADERIRFISFTGSVETGKKILHAGADRLAKISIEAGGKNPFVVCDDADMETAATSAVAAGFVDAGQRCAAASRVIVFDAVYDKFKKLFLEKVSQLKVGVSDADNYGAIISEKRMRSIIDAVSKAVGRGAVILCGGKRMEDEAHQNGYFITPTVLENVDPEDEISCNELFGPVVILYRADDFKSALELANNAKFKLSGAIHTASIHRAQEFVRGYRAGVIRVNGPTHGSEPHIPFGGVGLSGNGWREPGSKALDFYSEWRQVSIDHNAKEV